LLKGLRGANVFAMTLDFVGATVLALYALILGPLGVLRGPLQLERTVWYLWVLLPQGLMARSVRCAIDWRLGNFDSAIAQLEGLVGSNEEYYKDRPGSRVRRRVLEDFYTLLARAYLHAGHIDDAMLVVIRAKKSMAIDRLAGLAELDAKTAHLVRAGLAAGRLLDGGGLATMFVRSNQPEAAPPPARKGQKPKRQGASAQDESESPAGAKGSGAKKPGGRAPAKETGKGGAASAAPDGEAGGASGAKIIPFPPAAKAPGPRS
jgi:hypothetical protein